MLAARSRPSPTGTTRIRPHPRCGMRRAARARAASTTAAGCASGRRRTPRRADVVRHAREHPAPAAERPARATALPFVIEYDGELAGQLNVSSHRVRLAVVGDDRVLGRRERFAGRGITPTAVALATDHCFDACACTAWRSASGPRTQPSLRVVEKLGFRYEGAAAALHPHQRRLARPRHVRRLCVSPRQSPRCLPPLDRLTPGRAGTGSAPLTSARHAEGVGARLPSRRPCSFA